jgi:AraC family transcriptional regulator
MASTDLHPIANVEQAGRLITLAMTLFNMDREVAWRCLSRATTLLNGKLPISGLPRHGVYCRGSLADWQAKRVHDYIAANLQSKLSVHNMAASVALSNSHFSRAFKRRFGFAPMVYVSMKRIEQAKLMITSTRERLTDIALACGFADQSHLNRCFRRSVGVSPGRYRRNNFDAAAVNYQRGGASMPQSA